MGFFARILGLEDSQEEWQRDQVERGGTRASATLQNENKGPSVERYREIARRGYEANPNDDRRSGDDRRG